MKKFILSLALALTAVCCSLGGVVTLASAQEEHTCQFTVYAYDDEAHWFACECGETDQTPIPHAYAVKQDETGHWEECACKKTQGKESHNFATKHDDEGHWEECSVCKRTTPKNNHAGGSMTCTGRKECLICDTPYGEEPIGHSYELDADATHHWQVCEECDAEGEKSAHFGGKATEDEQAICEECGEPYGDFGEPTLEDEEEEGAQEGCKSSLGGSFVWLGGFCILAVLRKKKFF